MSTRHHWVDSFIIRRQGPDGRKSSTMNSTATCLTWRGMGSIRLYFAEDSPCDDIFTQAPRETFTTLLSLPTAQRSVTCAAMTLRSDMFWSSSQRPFRQAGSSTRQGKGRRQSIGMAFCQDLDRIEIESKTHTPSCNY